MQIGKLKKQSFVDHHQDYGFTSKTQMIDAALAYFERLMKRNKRRQWKQEALKAYAAIEPQNYFESIEGDDFE